MLYAIPISISIPSGEDTWLRYAAASRDRPLPVLGSTVYPDLAEMGILTWGMKKTSWSGSFTWTTSPGWHYVIAGYSGGKDNWRPIRIKVGHLPEKSADRVNRYKHFGVQFYVAEDGRLASGPSGLVDPDLPLLPPDETPEEDGEPPTPPPEPPPVPDIPGWLEWLLDILGWTGDAFEWFSTIPQWIWDSLKSRIPEYGDDLLDWFTRNRGSIWSALVEYFLDFGGFVGGKLSGILGFLKDVGTGLMELHEPVLERTADAIKEVTEAETPEWGVVLGTVLRWWRETDFLPVDDKIAKLLEAPPPETIGDARAKALDLRETIVEKLVSGTRRAALQEAATLGQMESGWEYLNLHDKISGLSALSSEIFKIGIDASILAKTRRWYNFQYTPALPDISWLITMLVREKITRGKFDEVMQETGLPAYWSGKIWDAHFIAPEWRILVENFRRGLITKEALQRLKILVDYDPVYDKVDPNTGEAGVGGVSLWDTMLWSLPTLRRLRIIHEIKGLEPEEIRFYLRGLGYSPDVRPGMRFSDQDVMLSWIQHFQARTFMRRYLMTAQRAFRAGVITKAEVAAIADKVYHDPEIADWIELEKALRDKIAEKPDKPREEVHLTKGDLRGMLKKATKSESEVRTLLVDKGYTTEETNQLIEYWAAEEPEEAKRPTVGMIRGWLDKGIVSRAEAMSDILELGYDAETADRIIEDATYEPPPVEKDITLAQAIRAWRRNVRSESELRAWMSIQGYKSAAIETIIETEKAEVPVEEKKLLSEASVRGLLLGKDITEAQAKEILVLRGYSAEDAQRLIKLWVKPPIEKKPEVTEALAQRWMRKGVITEDRAREYVRVRGWEAEEVDTFIVEARMDAIEEEKEATKADIRRAYREEILTREDAEDHLKAITLSDRAIEIALAIDDGKIAEENRKREARLLEKEFKRELISRSDYKAGLLQVGYSEESADREIEETIVEMISPERALTKTDILRAYRYGIIDRDAAKVKLFERDYSEADAELILETEDAAKGAAS